MYKTLSNAKVPKTLVSFISVYPEYSKLSQLENSPI